MRRAITVVSLGLSLTVPGIALADQPNMQAALASLQQAQQAIYSADQCKCHGGHAASATQAINNAIREVREGIKYAEGHPR